MKQHKNNKRFSKERQMKRQKNGKRSDDERQTALQMKQQTKRRRTANDAANEAATNGKRTAKPMKASCILFRFVAAWLAVILQLHLPLGSASFEFFFVRLPFAATSFGVCCRFICRSLSLRSCVVCRSLPRCLPKRNEAALGRTGGLGSWVSSIGIEYMVFVVFVTHFLEYISLQNGLHFLFFRHRWVIEKTRCADRHYFSLQLHNQRKFVKFFFSHLFCFLVGRERVHKMAWNEFGLVFLSPPVFSGHPRGSRY